MDKLLSIQEYIYQNKPDLLEIVQPEYQNYLNWVSPSTFLKLGHTYKVTKEYPGEEWMLDDYDVYLDSNHTVSNPGIVLHFQRKFPCRDSERKECWHTPQECYSLCMQDITKEEAQVEVGTHKYKVQWYWHPEHFKKDSDSWRDAIAIEFHYSKSKGMYYDDAPNRYGCNIFWRNGQYDDEADKIFCVSEWNCLRLGADNTCWCVDIGSGRSYYSNSGRYEGRFTLREAKKKYLGVNSLRELTPIFTSLPPFNDNTLKVRLFKTNVLYIYGYGSSPESRTCLALKELLPDANVISVHYDQADPEVAVNQLVDAVRGNDIDLVIGSSLGGWYAMHVCARTDKPCILINPLTDYTLIPTLRYVSDGTAFYGISIDNYREFKINHPLFFPTMIGNRWQVECWNNMENGDITCALVSDSDEVINHEDDCIYSKEHSLEVLKDNIFKTTVVKNGKHRLSVDELKSYLVPTYEELMSVIVPRYKEFYENTPTNP